MAMAGVELHQPVFQQQRFISPHRKGWRRHVRHLLRIARHRWGRKSRFGGPAQALTKTLLACWMAAGCWRRRGNLSTESSCANPRACLAKLPPNTHSYHRGHRFGQQSTYTNRKRSKSTRADSLSQNNPSQRKGLHVHSHDVGLFLAETARFRDLPKNIPSVQAIDRLGTVATGVVC